MSGRFSSVCAFVCVAVFGCASTSTVPGEPRQDPAEGGEQPMPAEMAKWAEAAAPGEHHAHLAMLEGSWDATTTHWMAPGASPNASKGTATNTLILGGRFLQLDYRGAFQMGGKEFLFTGLGLLGYDNIDRWHTMIWMDTTSTSIMFQQGTCDEDGRNITVNGDFADPTKPERTPVRSVFRVENRDRYVLDMYIPDKEGNEFLQMQIVHVRKQ